MSSESSASSDLHSISAETIQTEIAASRQQSEPASAFHESDGSQPDGPIQIEAAKPAPTSPDVQTTTNANGTEIRINVTPGETVVLPPPFTTDAGLEAKIGNGNLALKHGDTTVILQHYVADNDQQTITVETNQGKVIDVATVLAETDPNLDIQTAAGPAVGAQNATNGHLFAAFGPFGLLGGFTAVGPLDQTALSYGLIDATYRQVPPTGLQANGAEAPDITSSTGTVNEAALPFGSNPTSPAETTTGFITISAPDGVASITIDGKSVDLSDPSATGTIHGSYGDLTVTGWNPSTGELDYSYTLTNNFHHPDIQGPNVAQGEDFTVTATDKGGASGNGDIAIDIIDDVPTARNDVANVCHCGNATGNVLTNDTPGADGIAAIIAITDGGHTYSVDSSGVLTSNDSPANYSYDAATGELHIDHTAGGGSFTIDLSGKDIGDYSYTQGSATGADDIKYTEIDGDGDVSSAHLSIQPYLPAPHAVDDHIFLTSADPFIANSWLLNNDSPESGVKLLNVFNEHQVGIVQSADGFDLSVDSGHYFGSFDYTIETPGGKTDSAFVQVDLVTDPTGHSIDQSTATSDVILVGDLFDNILKGGAGDDVLVGNGGHDQLFGNGGDDTMSYEANASFNGGSGTDTITFGDATTIGFDSSFVGRVHSVEVLDFRNGEADTIGGGKGETLTAEAVLDMTDGKGDFWIAGESHDQVTIDKGFTQGADVINSTPHDGVPDGTYATYTGSFAGHTATLHIDTDMVVHHAG